MFELWRLPNQEFNKDRFVSILEKFQMLTFEKQFGIPVSPTDVISYLDASDMKFDDLYAYK